MRLWRWLAWGISLAAAMPAWSLTPLTSLRAVPDITVVLAGTTVGPQQLAVDNLMGGVSTLGVGAIPPNAQIVAYALLPNGDQLFALDVSADLGALSVRPGEVIRNSGGTLSLEYDATARGLPAAVRVDAITIVPPDLVLSFDVSLLLQDTDVLFTAEDEDLVRVTDAGQEIVFDASAAGIDSALDLDAAQYLDSGRLLLSFDGSGRVGGIAFDDEDVLEYDMLAMTWELAYDGTNLHDALNAADLTSVFAIVAGPSTPTATPTAPSPATATRTPSRTATAPATATAPPDATPSHTLSRTATRTATPAPSDTAPPNATPSHTPSGTATLAASPTATPTGPPPATATVTATPLFSAPPTDTPPAGTPTATPIPAACGGDCDRNGRVAINELVLLVNIALERLPVSSCANADRDRSGSIAINEIVAAVNQALGGCPQ